jgi:threonine/homoserine/homoserine lactone efflux protein
MSVTDALLAFTLLTLTLILATRSASGVLRKPGVVKWMDRVTGCAFLLFAAKLGISRR